jgi:membrane-bound inhibitor of C-type lysozyme
MTFLFLMAHSVTKEMAQLLAPVTASFYTEFFEQHVISLAAKKPADGYRYMDDTFTVWTHGKEELQSFLQHHVH